jgi:hypothetical protein
MDSDLNKFDNKYIFSNLFSNENKTVLLYGISLFIFPMIFTQQLIVGTIVNALLINSAITIRTKKVFLLALIPSIAVVSGGVLFGGLSSQIILMMPFIWIGNGALMYFTRKLFVKKKISYFKSSATSAAIKVLILSIASIVLFTLEIVPEQFVIMFGALQIVTVICAILIIFLKNFSKEKFLVKN